MTHYPWSSLSPTNPDPIESRFDIHLRIPVEEEVIDEVEQVYHPTVDINGQIGDLETDPAVLTAYVWEPWAEYVAGNSSEVPAKGDPSVSDPASGICQADHQLYPPVSVPPEPRQSLQFLAVVVYVAMETNLSVLDKITCKVDVKIWDPGAVCWTTCLHSNKMVFSTNSTNQCYVRVTMRATNSHLRAFPWPREYNAFMQHGILASKDAQWSHLIAA